VCLQDGQPDAEEVEAALRTGDVDINSRNDSFGWTPFLFAANTGNVQVLKLVLEARAQPLVACNNNNTALHVAARAGHLQAVEYILAKRAEVDAQNENGWTPLMLSTINGHEEVACALMNAFADVLVADSEGMTVAMWAARHGFLGITKTLLARGLDLDVRDCAGLTVMDHACEHLELQAAILAMGKLNRRLLEAAIRNDVFAAREALSAGAHVNTVDVDGWSPLLWALKIGSEDAESSHEMLKLLVQHGARYSDMSADCIRMEELELGPGHIAMSDALDSTLATTEQLLSAAKSGDWKMVENTLSAGAWPNIQEDGSLQTPLMWAVINGAPEAAATLVNARALLENRSVLGWTAAHFSVSSKSLETVSALHYLGADYSVPIFAGDFVHHMAARADEDVMVHVLAVGRADPSALNAECDAALQIAARSGCPSALNALLVCGADAEVRDHRERSLLALAVVHGHPSVAGVLLEPLRPLPEVLSEERLEEILMAAREEARGDAMAAAAEACSPLASPVAEGSTSFSQLTSPGEESSGDDDGAEEEDLDSKCGLQTLLIQAHRLNAARGELPKLAPPSRLLEEVDSEGRAPLALAAVCRRPDFVAMLLQRKARIDAIDAEGQTALMLAAAYGDRFSVERLLDAKAKVDLRGKDGKRAFDLAQSSAIRDMLRRNSAECKLPRSCSLPAVATAAGGGARGAAEAADSGGKRRGGGQGPQYRVRVECLPKLLPRENVEAQVRTWLRGRSVFDTFRVDVRCCPITARPLGYAYIDFAKKASAETAREGDRDEIVQGGARIRVFAEPRPADGPRCSG